MGFDVSETRCQPEFWLETGDWKRLKRKRKNMTQIDGMDKKFSEESHSQVGAMITY